MNFIDKIAYVKPTADLFNHTYISLRNHYMYTAVGKAANSTVKHHIYQLEYHGTRFKAKSIHDRQSSPLLSPFQLPDDLMEEVFTSSKYYRFSIVRNPYSRLLSCYLDRIVPADSAPYRQLMLLMGKPIGTLVSFAEFIEAVCKQMPYDQNNHWRLQTSEIGTSAIEYDFVGKQENFAADMATVWQHIAPSRILPNFTTENKAPSITSANERLNQYYTPELIEMVKEAYSDDFKTFGYSPDL
jgi:hypothetical protein